MPEEKKVTKDTLLEKFEFFFIGLIFTVLGASIQTVDFSNISTLAVVTELLSWFLFLVSGLVGLNKLEWLPNMVYMRDKIQNRKDLTSKLQAMSKVNSKIMIAETREYKDIHHIIDKTNDLSKLYEEEFQKLIKKHSIKNNIQRWTFYIAFVLIAFSRSYDQILSLIK